jgi:transposase
MLRPTLFSHRKLEAPVTSLATSAFIATLGWSRATFVEFVTDERMETLLGCHPAQRRLPVHQPGS